MKMFNICTVKPTPRGTVMLTCESGALSVDVEFDIPTATKTLAQMLQATTEAEMITKTFGDEPAKLEERQALITPAPRATVRRTPAKRYTTKATTPRKPRSDKGVQRKPAVSVLTSSLLPKDIT